MIRKRFYIICVAVILLSVLKISAQSISVKVSIDTNNVLIGDHVTYHYTFTFPSDGSPVLPVIADTLSKNIEVISMPRIDTAFLQDRKMLSLHQKIIISCYDSGSFTIPSLRFGFFSKGDSIQTIVSDSLVLNVGTVNVDTTKAIKDIKAPIHEPLTWRDILPWVLLGAGVLVIIGIAIYIIVRIRKKKPLIPVRPIIKIPPHEKALQELERLRNEKIWQKGKIKEYYSELTDIIRIYIEERFDLNAMEMITDEIMESLKEGNINGENLERLRKLLVTADMVKFAKYQPFPDEHDYRLKDAVAFVKENIPEDNDSENNKEDQPPINNQNDAGA